MKNFFQVYRLLNVLSIDVAIGAVIGAMFFAKIFDITVLPYGLISLGLSVWIIYTADHLIDARKVQQPASSERHRFHQQYFNILFVLLMVSALVDGAQLFFVRRIVLIEGLVLALAVGVYFLIQQSLKFFKEVIGAVLYSGGVLLIPLSGKMDELSTSQLILIGQFALTALINLLLFSWFDKQQDERDKRSSFATVMGEKATQTSITILFFVQVILACVQFLIGNFEPTIILIFMNGLLLLIFLNRKYFETQDRYRLLGDAIFLLPLIYVLL